MIALQPRELAGPTAEELDARVTALRALLDAQVPFMVTGAYALFEHTGIYRETKDLDVAVRRHDLDSALAALQHAGFRTELLDPVWIAKAYSGTYYVDLLFSSGNGIATVDDAWFRHATSASVMGHLCLITPPEEMIWTKGFVNERERYDGADVNHLIYACGDALDWERLLARFEPHWEVLFSHLVLYRFAYPGERSRVPDWLMTELCARTLRDVDAGDAPTRVCRGSLISRVQYRPDYECFGFQKEPVLAEAPAPKGGA